MRTKIAFAIMSLLLVSCADSSESGGSNKRSNDRINNPISIESGAWLIHGLSLANNTCGAEVPGSAAERSSAAFPIKIGENKGVLTMTVGKQSNPCERTGDDFSCSFVVDEGDGVNKGHGGPYGGDEGEEVLWEPELKWTCSDCNGADLADALTINGVSVQAPQGVCYDTATQTTSITLKDDCATMSWVSFADEPGEAPSIRPFLVQITVSGTLDSPTSLNVSLLHEVVCKDGESAQCAEFVANNADGYIAIPCAYTFAGLATHCGPDENTLSEQCKELRGSEEEGYSKQECDDLRAKQRSLGLSCHEGDEDACKEVSENEKILDENCYQAGAHHHHEDPDDDEDSKDEDSKDEK